MGTINDKLAYLDDTKLAIKEAIQNKGVSVTDEDTFRSYAEKISSIEAGGGAVGTTVTAINKTSSVINQNDKVWLNEVVDENWATNAPIYLNELVSGNETNVDLFSYEFTIDEMTRHSTGNVPGMRLIESSSNNFIIGLYFGLYNNSPIVFPYYYNGQNWINTTNNATAVKFNAGDKIRARIVSTPDFENKCIVIDNLTQGTAPSKDAIIELDPTVTVKDLVVTMDGEWDDTYINALKVTTDRVWFSKNGNEVVDYDPNETTLKQLWAVDYENTNEDSVIGVAQESAEVNARFSVMVGGEIGDSVMPETLIITPNIEDGSSVEEFQYDEFEAPYTDSFGNEYDGAGTIKVRKIGSWIDSEVNADNIRVGHSILGVAGTCVELVPQDNVTVKSQANKSQTITPSKGYNGITSITVEPWELQAKTVDPYQDARTFYPDSGYEGMSSVTVRAVTADVDPQIIPENIKEGVNILGVEGTYVPDIPEYVTEEINIVPKTTSQAFEPDEGVDAFSKVTVSAVTSTIDPNIVKSNIRYGVNILGVEGDYSGGTNLQSKVASPKTESQRITYDNTYDGLKDVTISAVTAEIDKNIIAENIKEGVTILGVEGSMPGSELEIEPAVTVTPSIYPNIVKPSEGYDVLSQVNIEGVTSAIDANILAENIKKNIEILGVTGTFEGANSLQGEKVVTPGLADIVVGPDSTYDALLSVIVKAVEASIDPNIIPSNIKKNVTILGVTGTVEEGEKQKWFDFSTIKGYTPLGSITLGGGGNTNVTRIISTNNHIVEEFVNEEFDSIENITAALFNMVAGYENTKVDTPTLYQPYVLFNNAQFYTDYDDVTIIEPQLRYLYPLVNNENVKGCTIGYEDNGQASELSLYVMIDSTKLMSPIPVLVNGALSSDMLLDGYDSFRFVSLINIPEHTVFVPKTNDKLETHWIEKDSTGVIDIITEHDDQPLTIDISAWDKDNDKEDNFSDKSFYTATDEIGKVNSLVIDGDFIASNFSSSNYINCPNTIISNYFDLIQKATYNGTTSTEDEIWFSSTDRPIGIYQGKYGVYQSGWKLGTNVFTAGTTYWFRAIYDNGSVKLYWIVDNGEYTLDTLPEIAQWNEELVVDGITNMFTGQTIRLSRNNAAYWRGTMDLKGTKIVSGQGLLWQPISKMDYKNITDHTIVPITKDIMFYERTKKKNVQLKSPFTDFSSYLENLVDGNNFIINGNYIVSGPSSYKIAYGTSYGYIKYTTGPNSIALTISGYVSSEYNYDFGGVYIGKQKYTPTREQIANKTTDGVGSWLFTGSGDMKLSTYTTKLEPNTTYYINFAYAKEGGGDKYEDRLVIEKIIFGKEDVSNTIGNLLNYLDEGGAINMPLYYVKTSKTTKEWQQPILKENGIMGVSEFAVAVDGNYDASSKAYHLFDDNPNSWWRKSVNGVIEFFSSTPIKVTNIIWDAYSNCYPTSSVVYGSNDREEWTQITTFGGNSSTTFEIDMSSNENYYNYYKIDMPQRYNDPITCYGLHITAEVEEHNIYEYILSPDDSFVDNDEFLEATFVDTISIPEHYAEYLYDQDLMKFVKTSLITLNVDDDNTTIYTEIED